MPKIDNLPSVTILSYGLGGGHHRVASLLKNSLLERGCIVKLIYLEDCAGFIFNLFFFHGYLFLYRYFPFLWGVIYRRSLKWRNGGVTPLILLKRVSDKVLKLLDSPDLIISTQINCSEIAAFLKNSGRVKSLIVTIVTDYDAIPIWAQKGVDLFFLPEKDLAERLGEFLYHTQRALSFGLPVDKRFYDSKKDETILIDYGLIKERKIVLLMGGSLGISGMKSIVSKILRIPQIQIISVCGINKRLKKKIEKYIPESNGRLVVFGFTDLIPNLMSVSDVLITKSGGLTLAEARASGIPIFLLPPICGQEEANYNYFIGRGWAHPLPDVSLLENVIKGIARNEKMPSNGIAVNNITEEILCASKMQ